MNKLCKDYKHSFYPTDSCDACNWRAESLRLNNEEYSMIDLKKELTELAAMGWYFTFDFAISDDGELVIVDGGAFIGDSGCHVRKFYDPEDSHGYTSIDFLDLFKDETPSVEAGMLIVYNACKEAEKNFGKSF